MNRVAIIVSVLLAAVSGTAEAYPYFQTTSETDTCSQCHFAPAGGGLLTSWGRGEAGDAISVGGDGSFLHGAVELPGWLELGGDFRVAGLINDTGTPEGAEFATFPMQADLALRLSKGALSFTARGGLKGAARKFDAVAGSDRKEASFGSYLVSREHYVSWQPSAEGAYARAGRYYAPFGLRLPDHTTFIRRYAGFNLLEETYGVSGGYVGSSTELHVTAHVSDPIRWAPRDEFGATALFEARAGRGVYGVHTRGVRGGNQERVLGGAYAKYWFEDAKVLLMAELDGGYQRFDDAASGNRAQLIAYAGPVWIPRQGVYVGVAYEHFDEDLKVRDVERHAVSAWASVFPWAHFEVTLTSRGQRVGTDDYGLATLLQVHYYP